MKKALALLVIVLAAREARGETYRPLPRLPPAKVRSRAAESDKVPVPPPTSRGADASVRGDAGAAGAADDVRVGRATAPDVARPAVPTVVAPPLRRVRRTGPPPPLQDEVGRTIVFASAPALQDDAGRVVAADERVHVIVLPPPGTRGRGAMK